MTSQHVQYTRLGPEEAHEKTVQANRLERIDTSGRTSSSGSRDGARAQTHLLSNQEFDAVNKGLLTAGESIAASRQRLLETRVVASSALQDLDQERHARQKCSDAYKDLHAKHGRNLAELHKMTTECVSLHKDLEESHRTISNYGSVFEEFKRRATENEDTIRDLERRRAEAASQLQVVFDNDNLARKRIDELEKEKADLIQEHEAAVSVRELRLKIWRLALPACTVEQVWNRSKLKWEFVREIPAVLQASSDARREFLRSVDVPVISSVYRCVMDVRPFYFCYTLDTIYVQRQCLFNLPLRRPATYHDAAHFNLNLVREHLRSLQMDWGLGPYWSWWSQIGPAFVRSFPRLERFTLVVTISRWDWVDGEKEMLVGIVKKQTAAQFEIEQSQHPDWRMPMIRFYCRKDSIDWIICSRAESPEATALNCYMSREIV